MVSTENGRGKGTGNRGFARAMVSNGRRQQLLHVTLMYRLTSKRHGQQAIVSALRYELISSVSGVRERQGRVGPSQGCGRVAADDETQLGVAGMQRILRSHTTMVRQPDNVSATLSLSLSSCFYFYLNICFVSLSLTSSKSSARPYFSNIPRRMTLSAAKIQQRPVCFWSVTLHSCTTRPVMETNAGGNARSAPKRTTPDVNARAVLERTTNRNNVVQ